MIKPDKIFPINRKYSFQFWDSVSKETFIFLDSLFKKYAELFNSGSSKDYKEYSKEEDIRINEFSRVNNLRIVLLTQFCLTCESMLNFYGVIKLGEKFFKENIERIGPISKKIIVLKSICAGELYDKNLPLLKKLDKLFKCRNDFIHPKYKDQLPDNEFDIIIDVKHHFKVDFAKRFKKLIRELSIFLVGQENIAGNLFLTRYNWL